MKRLFPHIIFLFTIISPAGFSQNPRWALYNTRNSGLPDNRVYSVFIDSNDVKWFCTADAVVRFDNKEWLSINRKSKKGAPLSIPRMCSTDGLGNLWIGTWGDGMSKAVLPSVVSKNSVKEIEWIQYDDNNSPLKSNILRALCSDRDKRVWLATDDGLLRIAYINWDDESKGFDGTGIRWSVFDTANSGLPDNRILSAAIDKRGVVWAGTFGGGLTKYDGMFWTVYNARNSLLPDNFILTITVDDNNNKWIGTYNGGLVCFDGKNWTLYNKHNSSLPDNHVTIIGVDKKGVVFAGTRDSGLSEFDGKKWNPCRLFDSDAPYSVTSIAVDKFNNKWIGTGGGVVVYNAEGINREQ
ncbi:MAG: hypothetical protein HYY40_11040 [Bacteroidetes bacterium]|nr:hypothetical protein [Bacteroidota bacterium]